MSSSSVRNEPFVLPIVEIQIAIATLCLISSVALVILSSLQLYPLLLPAYITGGASVILFVLATVSHLAKSCHCKPKIEVELTTGLNLWGSSNRGNSS